MREADEPLASGAIEVAETHPDMLRFPYVGSWLGEVSHTWGVLIFCGGMLTGIMVGLYWVAPWFLIWKFASILTATDYHAPNTLWRWLRTAAWDRHKHLWGGTSVADNPRAWDVPLGMFD